MTRMMQKLALLLVACVSAITMFGATAQAQNGYAPHPAGLPLVTYPNNFGAQDPYVCGEGFFGVISGGIGVYTVDYYLHGAIDVDLPAFEIDIQGNFQSPYGYVSPATVPAGKYRVTYTVRDAYGQLARGSYDANIDHACAPVPVDAAGVPAAIPVPAETELAFTGADVNLPLAGAAILIGSGGLMVLAANKRRFEQF